MAFFVSDLDGTLFDHTHDMDDVVYAGIMKILDKGHYFAFCTGRGMQKAKDINFSINHDHIYTICMNGALIYKDKDTIIFKKPIDKEIIRLLIEEFDDIFIRFESSRDVYYTYSEDEGNNYFDDEGLYLDNREWCMDFYRLNSHYKASVDDILKADIYKINFSISNKAKIKRVNDFLDRYSDKLVNAPWSDGFFDITDASVDKAYTLKWLCEYLNIKEDEVFVYGDAINDINMLKMFKNSFSPSNAIEAAKNSASAIIGDYDEHSVIRHMLENI